MSPYSVQLSAAIGQLKGVLVLLNESKRASDMRMRTLCCEQRLAETYGTRDLIAPAQRCVDSAAFTLTLPPHQASAAAIA